MVSRRQMMMSTLFGAGYVGLRALATGLPASFLFDPRKALAGNPAPSCPTSATAPQFVILSTSANGDPLNANVPGTYEDSKIAHSTDPRMAPTPISLLGQRYTAAAPWATLPQTVLDRTCFWHTMTNTPVHPKEPDVLKLMDATMGEEMLPSILAQQLAACLGTVQTQPICVGASSPSEALTFGGQALPIIPPTSLKATLTNAAGGLTNLQPLRDQTLNELYGLYRDEANPLQRQYIDSLVTSQTQVRNIRQDLLAQLASITDNSTESQILAAITLIQMKVAPVVSIHVPFGGDNHSDPNLATETNQTISGVASIVSLMEKLEARGLQDSVTFMTLNVFGRTIGAGNAEGRSHNPNHQVSLTIGKPFAGGVIGGVAPVGEDYGCTAIDSKTGFGSASGDVSPQATLSAFGQTVMAAVGIDRSAIPSYLPSGVVLESALA